MPLELILCQEILFTRITIDSKPKWGSLTLTTVFAGMDTEGLLVSLAFHRKSCGAAAEEAQRRHKAFLAKQLSLIEQVIWEWK